MSVVEVNNLVKAYNGFKLGPVTFALEKGRIYGFIGRNGAGKTTTIKSMLNLVHPDSGEISFFDKMLKENEAETKKSIGYSTGSISWYPRKKISEIVAVTKEFYDTWDDEAFRKYRELFCIDENKTPIELSEGMKIKFNLLLALSHRAEVLILDEPTSGLDSFSRDELLEIFKKLKESGVTVLFSTHIISDIEKCADDIIYISKGKIKEAMSKTEFVQMYSRSGESLEQIVLRLERGELHE